MMPLIVIGIVTAVLAIVAAYVGLRYTKHDPPIGGSTIDPSVGNVFSALNGAVASAVGIASSVSQGS